MTELLAFAFSGVNIIPTILLIFTILYWLIVIVGVIDIDALDFDFDVDGDVELEGLASVLSFFNIGHMPLMVFITFFTIPLWMVTLITNDLLGVTSFIAGLLIFLPATIACLFVAKFFTIPIAKIYRKIRTETEAIKDIIGRVCIAKLPISHDRKGQAEIKINGTSILITAKTREGYTVPKNATALIIEFQKAQNFYFVEPYQLN
ncbi:MAG: hypothetical protein ACJA0X_000623 [Cyclobacteriaceae bacterium]|jgi:hypothetical protein